MSTIIPISRPSRTDSEPRRGHRLRRLPAHRRRAPGRASPCAWRATPRASRWREYGERVRAIAEGLSSLGLRRGDTLALLLTNRVEFHLLDAAAIHLGAVPFSIYTTSSPEQIEFLLRDSGARIAVTEDALLDRLEKALQGEPELDHLLMVERLAEVESRRTPGFDFEATLARGRPRRPAHADLHLGHHRSAEGRRAHAPEPARRLARHGRGLGPPERGRVGHLVPPLGPHRGPLLEPLRSDAVRPFGDLLPRPAPDRASTPRRTADAVRRRPARLAEAQGRRGAGGAGLGAGHRPPRGGTRAARRAAPRGAACRARASREARASPGSASGSGWNAARLPSPRRRPSRPRCSSSSTRSAFRSSSCTACRRHPRWRRPTRPRGRGSAPWGARSRASSCGSRATARSSCAATP